ncbi:chorion peroxidase-like [Pollicipes pollicipes]|uniref:chorion peroxidase-like n=1 Tax=Pollicipes pollicipes TaxID=41117 RepID=UPI001884E0CD|nr:chorion peroxidase-like [Pollicipes pollicipes]
MAYGQFIAHDTISTPTQQLGTPGARVSCCGPNNSFPEDARPPGCIPIRVPDDDPHFAKFNRTCIHQVRSMVVLPEDCILAPNSQRNGLTHFLDASNVYGSSKMQADLLRAFSGGLLKMTAENLPPRDSRQFIAGEGRSSENPGLTFLHIVWMREHNRVARALAKSHPNWDDEKLYQEARRIVIGEYQHIVYNEYVPAVVGYRYARQHGLDPERGYSFNYQEQLDPRITSEFSTAAFRFGHSQVQDAFILESETGRLLKTLNMADAFFKDNLLLEPGAVAQMARSLTRQKPRSVDRTVSPAVHEHLFQTPRDAGIDLLALNINRGRDHGLPTYINVLENCLERKIGDGWEGLKKFFEPAVLERLQSVYSSPYDIDLYIGGLTEKSKLGAVVGETFQCIIGQQFFTLRYADRFFFDHAEQPHSFTEEQVKQIQRASWARILCDNVEDLERVQPLALRQPSTFANGLASCNSFAIPSVNLSIF